YARLYRNGKFAASLVIKSEYLSDLVHADSRVGHMLGVCYFPKIWLLLQHLTNCSGWSICSEIPWSISAGIGGQFIPNSGGQYHRNLQYCDNLKNFNCPAIRSKSSKKRF